MHRCLEIQEIVSLICKQLSIPSTSAASNNGSLAALAISCRSFQEPALDTLWYRQSSLIPLVKCFPQSSWEINNGEDANLSFCRVPSPEEWSRVLRYAARIRFLQSPGEGTSPPPQFQFAPTSVWRMLEFSKPENTTYIFPNLLYVSLAENNASLPHCRILIGPAITGFELCLFGEAHRVSFLISVMESCPLLHNISALPPKRKRGEDSLQKAMFTHGISNAIMRKNNLRNLNIGSLTPAAFAHIADMTSLTELCLFDNSPLGELLGRSQKRFPSLRTLLCVGPDLQWIGNLLQIMESPILDKVKLYVLHTRHTSDIWIRTCTALRTSCANLSRLTLEEGGISLDDDENYVLGRNLLILPVFQNLTAIHINPRGGFDIDNQDLKDVSAGWPRLKDLTLGISGPWIRPSRVTLKGLIPLLAQCPLLQTLGIVVDATVDDDALNNRPGRGICNTKITSLKVGSSRIQNPVNVAAFLSDILPCVTKIKAWVDHRNIEDTRQSDWNLVARNIKVFTSAHGWELIGI